MQRKMQRKRPPRRKKMRGLIAQVPRFGETLLLLHQQRQEELLRGWLDAALHTHIIHIPAFRAASIAAAHAEAEDYILTSISCQVHDRPRPICYATPSLPACQWVKDPGANDASIRSGEQYIGWDWAPGNPIIRAYLEHTTVVADASTIKRPAMPERE
jgi:hypothetical protein